MVSKLSEMGRTIHDTLGVAERALTADWSDPAIPRAIADEMRRNWLRQRAIRDGERRVRRRGALPPQPVSPEHVPIVIEDDAPYLRYGATEEDIRAVFRRLPPGSLDGLQEVRLCLDREDAQRGTRVRDPFTQRLRHELVPGVFVPGTLGVYNSLTANIRIHAYLSQAEAASLLALYLKVKTLKTVVHEVAHHFDHTFRKRRSRWATEEKEKHESWAEHIEVEQSREIILPYIVERYPRERDELARWIEGHAGVAVDPVPLLFFEGPLLVLARGVLEGRERDTTSVDFARALHKLGANNEARAVAGSVLARCPDDAPALAVSACISHCKDRDHQRAELLCRRALATDPGCMEAWDVLVRGYAIEKRWAEVVSACNDAIARTADGQLPAWYFVTTLAEAHLRLGDWMAVESDVARMRTWGDERAARAGDVYVVLSQCWSERWDEALLEASRLLDAGQHDDWKLWLAAAKFEAAHRLGQPAQAGAFNDAQLRELEGATFTEEWARRIRRHVGSAPGRSKRT